MVDLTNIEFPQERPIYLDCAATTPIESEVLDIMLYYFKEEFGNSSSRTHLYGTRAKQAVENARVQVAGVVDCDPSAVIFTSGATESNNLAILGLSAYGLETGRRHIVSTQIEHKAVLEPLEEMQRRGFEVTLLAPNSDGWVEPFRIENALRKDTLLVSVMHANNETGVIQPIDEITSILESHPTFFHVDAAQTFGKVADTLRNQRIDLVSISAHKIYGPKGVGALVTRRRNFLTPPLKPIMHGGGQERGLRPGTVPVPLVAGFGEASRLALLDFDQRFGSWCSLREELGRIFANAGEFIGDQRRTIPTTASFELANIDAQSFFVAAKSTIAISDGAACSTNMLLRSHVLQAMGMEHERIDHSIRISWSHRTRPKDFTELEHVVQLLTAEDRLDLELRAPN
jgi:cysteine desulfurase